MDARTTHINPRIGTTNRLLHAGEDAQSRLSHLAYLTVNPRFVHTPQYHHHHTPKSAHEEHVYIYDHQRSIDRGTTTSHIAFVVCAMNAFR